MCWISKVGEKSEPWFDRCYAFVGNKKADEVCACYYLDDEVNIPDVGKLLSACVSNVRLVFEFANLVSHGLRYLSKLDETVDGSSVENDNEGFCLSDIEYDTRVNLVVTPC